MGAVRIVILATAAVAAIVLAFVVRGMVSPKTEAVAAVAPAPPRPMAQVLVAARDLPVGVRLAAADLTWQPWPVEALNASFVTDGAAPAVAPEGAAKVAETAKAAAGLAPGSTAVQAFEGAIVKEALVKGEPMVARKVVRAGESGYLAVVLNPGMRAMSIPITAETGAGGFVLPGDRVDVLQSRQGPEGQGYVTETLMRNLRVLAIDQRTDPEKDAKTIVGAVAVLEVPASDAEVLARGKAQGEMQLALRSYADMSGGAARGVAQRGNGLRVVRGVQVQEVAVR